MDMEPYSLQTVMLYIRGILKIINIRAQAPAIIREEYRRIREVLNKMNTMGRESFFVKMEAYYMMEIL